MTRITDVARAAGVSPATVSRVLNQPAMVAPDKRDRVLAAVRELGYKPNAIAQSLRAGAVNTIALLVGDISQPFHGAFAKAISRRGEALGYRVLLGDLDHKEERLVHLLGQLNASDTYGAVLATADDLGTPVVLEAIRAAQGRGVVVVSSSQVVAPEVPAIVPRYQAISHLAAIHLATQGCKPIVFIGAGSTSPLSRERQDGFARACAELGLGANQAFVLDGQFSVDQSREQLHQLFAENPAMLIDRTGPVGVITINMRTAIGALQAAADHGLRVPQDLCLVCGEDLPLAAEWRPTVTTVGIDFDGLAEAAFTSLLAGSDAAAVTYLPHRLTVRSSSLRDVSGG